MITTEDVKKLRDATGVSVMECKKALEEAAGDWDKAIAILKKKSASVAQKKGERSLGAGTVASYIHANGAVGAMVELSCETDFVAKNEEFKQLAYDIAMQVAATNPEYLRREDIGEEAQKLARDLFLPEVKDLDKPEEMKEKILSGKIDAYFAARVLLEQPFIKDETVTIQGIIEAKVQKFGERIELARIARFAVGS